MGTREPPQEDAKSKRENPLLHLAARRPAHLNLNMPKNHARVFSPSEKKAVPPAQSMLRDVSLSAAFRDMNLKDNKAQQLAIVPLSPQSPSKIPRLSAPSPVPNKALELSTKTTLEIPSRVRTPPFRIPFTPSPFPISPSKSARTFKFLTRDSNLEAWDPEEQYGNMERMYQDVVSHYKEAVQDSTQWRDVNSAYKATIDKLEEDKSSLTEDLITTRSELKTYEYRLELAERGMKEAKRDAEEEIEDVKRQGRIEIETIRQGHREELERSKSDHREELRDVKRRFEEELESERSQRIQALSQASTEGALEKQRQQLELDTRDRQILDAKAEVERINASLEREKALTDDLRSNLATAGTNAYAMESARQALQKKIDFLESNNQQQSQAYAEMEHRMTAAIEKAEMCEEKLRKEETLRRKLHNQVQELKGNIRVFCRVRPSPQAVEEELAKISFPSTEESTDLEIAGPEKETATGKPINTMHSYSFDRVFDQSASNAEVFDEISQLIQSALDGYNCCIFAYGQTGSGKTYTMSSEDGMIPRALRQIYSTSKDLESRGWKYKMEGSFVEVYNEELRDLLGKSNDSTAKKLTIQHDAVTCETTINGATTLKLNSEEEVESVLAQAMQRRSVAATKSNEHSSRSHSVFILKLQGTNSITGEQSKGTLNLVDLAGSERIKNSGAEGVRLEETKNINTSLAALGNIIAALGQKSAAGGSNPRSSVNGENGSGKRVHIPYRDSKLTYLLQNSLGGNSKTLMFVMVAPEKRHLPETLNSLTFANKVSQTNIGVAKKAK
jgi:kinesin family member C1